MELTFEFVENMEIYNMNNTPDMPAIFNSRANDRFTTVQDGYDEKIFLAQRSKIIFLSVFLLID